MPIYEYRCENGHTFEVMQRMADDPIAICEVCSEPVQRVFHPVAVHYKGSGFYSTDYGKKRSGGGGESSGSGGSKDESSKSESTGESKSSDSDSKPSSSSDSGSGGESKKSDSKSD